MSETLPFEKKNADDLIVAINNGKLAWTTPELLPYIIDLAGGSYATARSRAATIARTIAYGLQVSFDDSIQGRYVFGKPDLTKSAIKIIEVPVERVVEKVVEVPVEKVVEKLVEVRADGTKVPAGKQDLAVHLEFPEKPAQGKLNPKFQTPTWYRRMEVALNAGKHVALAGPPGIGKSTAPEQYFIKRNQPFVVVNGDAGFRRRDVEGSVEIQGGTTFFKVAEFAAAAINGWGCILNEVNAADPDALLWINGILEVPNMVTVHGKAYPVHPDFRLVVTYNPGLIGTKALPQAFKDRFVPVKLGFPSQDFLRKLVIAKTGLNPANPPYWLDRMLRFAQDAWAAHEKGTLRYQISPRRLFDAVFLMNEQVAQGVDEALRMAVVEAVDSAADTQVLERIITGAMSGPMNRFGGASR